MYAIRSYYGLFGAARDDRDDFHAVDVLEAVEVLFTESAGAGEGNTHVVFLHVIPAEAGISLILVGPGSPRSQLSLG